MESLEKTVNIQAGEVSLEGSLVVPDNAKGIVLFVHGSGSSRFSPRNNYVAKVLNDNNIATLLFDLLTRDEDLDYNTRFDIDLLSKRLLAATNWIRNNPHTSGLNIGYFGASTGAAAALISAAEAGNIIKATVSRGGRPDLALNVLDRVKSPTLLIVGGEDDIVIEYNKLAYAKLNTDKEIKIISGATHLFEEPGTLEQVAELAAGWFNRYL